VDDEGGAATRYAKATDGTHLAYQVVGDGPIDLVYIPSWASQLEVAWEHPSYAELLGRLASFARLIWFDKRGTGLSDRATQLPTLDQQVDDVTAVMDAVRSPRAAVFGHGDGAVLCAVLAAFHPDRVRALITLGLVPRTMQAVDYPSGWTTDFLEFMLSGIENGWGGPEMAEDLKIVAPSVASDRSFQEWYARFSRLSASPSAASELLRIASLIDIRSALGTISVPTLVLQRSGDPIAPPAVGRMCADYIAGSSYVELPGRDWLIYTSDVQRIADEIQEFLTGVRGGRSSDRVLATVLFTDIVASTERAAALGDERWRELLAAHDALVRRQLDRFRGREVNTTGDGFVATFDGPARAIQCGCAIRDGVGSLDLEVRVGLHAGEVEVSGSDVAGIAVHIAQRVQSLAAPGEVLVSRTLRDLVAGSGLRFEDRDEHRLKGVPGAWQLYSVQGS
jgi:class 3 adenylate cyclase